MFQFCRHALRAGVKHKLEMLKESIWVTFQSDSLSRASILWLLFPRKKTIMSNSQALWLLPDCVSGRWGDFMKLNMEKNRVWGSNMRPWVIAWHLQECPKLKVSDCVMWQMNICCCFVSQPFTSAGSTRRTSNSMVGFLFDVMNTYCSWIQLFLLF